MAGSIAHQQRLVKSIEWGSERQGVGVMERGVCRLGWVGAEKNTVGIGASARRFSDTSGRDVRAKGARVVPGENTERQGGILDGKKCGRGYLGLVMSIGGAWVE